MLLCQILDELEMEKKRGETLENVRKTNVGNYWWEAPVNELEQLRDAMEELKRIVCQQASEITDRTMKPVGVFDLYENKPNYLVVDSVNGHVIDRKFGYFHGIF